MTGIALILLILSLNKISCFNLQSIFSKIEQLPRPFASKYFPSDDGMIRVARPVSWYDCSEEGALFELQELTLTPDPPQRSAPLTVHVKGILKERLSAGTVNYTASFGGLQLVKGVEDGCALLAKEDEVLPQCPIDAGVIDVVHKVDLPWHIPPGRYFVEAQVQTEDARQVICLKLDVSIDLIQQ